MIVWTTKRPTAKGYYWFKLPGAQQGQIVWVQEWENLVNGSLVLGCGGVLLKTMEGEWAGPIPHP